MGRHNADCRLSIVEFIGLPVCPFAGLSVYRTKSTGRQFNWPTAWRANGLTGQQANPSISMIGIDRHALKSNYFN